MEFSELKVSLKGWNFLAKNVKISELNGFKYATFQVTNHRQFSDQTRN
jgi:hypothetical protein